MQRFCQTAWMSQNQSKSCSEVLRGLEVVKTNDIAQALNQTIQVQPFEALLGIQLHNVWGLSSIRDDPPPLTKPVVAEPCERQAHSDCRSDDTGDV